jgi:alpha-glucuronidase
MKRYFHIVIMGVLLLSGSIYMNAETGYEAWLRYAPLADSARLRYQSLPATVVVLGRSEVLDSADIELQRGVRGMLGRRLRVASKIQEPAIVLGTFEALSSIEPALRRHEKLRPDGFWLVARKVGGFPCLLVAGSTDRGALYGTFALLRKMALAQDLAAVDEIQEPYAPIRWVNEWNNLDGSIERGYAGKSIFFADGSVRQDLTRVKDYARLLASLGINGCDINNVNADPRLLTADFLPHLARVAEAFRPWGVRLALSVNFGAPKRIGDLDSFDPLDPRVAAWWKRKADEIYAAIPDFAGFVVKADSEGQVGPSSYQRSHADAANMLARALNPHGGLLFYRGFVYERRYDPGNPRNERAKAAYDNFHPLDGKFDDNVIIQIKNGPIDFQVREPVSPLFSGLEKTNEAIELQITQEYTGQQRHLCYLAPMWKEVLDFDLHAENPPLKDRDTEKNGPSEQPLVPRSPAHPITRSAGSSVPPCPRGRCGFSTPVKDLVAGRVFHRPTGGFVAVSNVGLDPTWLGHPLAMANLYAYGRLAWNPDMSSKQIAEEWTTLTFGRDPQVRATIVDMLLSSWLTFEDYSMSLGAGSMTNILDGNHYGPGIPILPASPDQNRRLGDASPAIGKDRSAATGTGYAGQYPPKVAALYEALATTPDELLLFFHRVPYTYVLHSGATVIQHIYNSHYAGAERAQQYVQQWKYLRGRVDDERYRAVLSRLEYQAGHAVVWRDAICNWFWQMSGVTDAKGRVGHYPGRVEAESLDLEGYVPLDVVPSQTASGGRAVECPPPLKSCKAIFHFPGKPGWYDMDVQYFDQNNGASRLRVLVGNQVVDEWTADDALPNAKVGGDTSTRRGILGLALRPGDEIRMEGFPDGGEHAAMDYIELYPAKERGQTAIATPASRAH